MSNKKELLLRYSLISTNKRLTFDIDFQSHRITYLGRENSPYSYMSPAGVQVIVQNQMDIQIDRLWLIGEAGYTRSGSMVFGNNTKRDAMKLRADQAIKQFVHALTPRFEGKVLEYYTHRLGNEVEIWVEFDELA